MLIWKIIFWFLLWPFVIIYYGNLRFFDDIFRIGNSIPWIQKCKKIQFNENSKLHFVQEGTTTAAFTIEGDENHIFKTTALSILTPPKEVTKYLMQKLTELLEYELISQHHFNNLINVGNF